VLRSAHVTRRPNEIALMTKSGGGCGLPQTPGLSSAAIALRYPSRKQHAILNAGYIFISFNILLDTRGCCVKADNHARKRTKLLFLR
jgi:hypothetical protein